MTVPQGAQRSDDGHWWWDEQGQQWQPVPPEERDPAQEFGSIEQGGYGGAPDGYREGDDGHGGESSSTVEELVHEAIEHGATHVVDTVAHGAFKVAEGTFTLFVMVVQIALGPGDTAMHEIPAEVYRYVACCDGDHNGANWQGPYRESQAEADDDVLRHDYEWPGHHAGAVTE